MFGDVDQAILQGIRVKNLRVFEGEHHVAVDPGLTVIMGRNNSGKSTLLRSPFMLMAKNRERSAWDQALVPGRFDIEVGLRFRFTTNSLSLHGLPYQMHRGWTFRDKNNLSKQVQFTQGFHADVLHEFELGWVAGFKDRLGRVSTVFGTEPGAFVRVKEGMAPMLHLPGAEPVQIEGAKEFGFHTLEADRLGADIFAYWEHSRTAGSEWIEQSSKRVVDAGEERLVRVLTYLRLKHPAEFDLVAETFAGAFPEFRLEFLEVSDGIGYRAGFVRQHLPKETLSREQIGAGAWAFLCIICAARAAKLSGAKVLLLDEPHLYLHPALERALIRELTEPKRWNERPLQIIAATHSPVFVNYALSRGTLNVVEWDSPAREKVSVAAYRSGDAIGESLHSRIPDAGGLLYADKLVFVEGPSDVVALQLLAPDDGSGARWVPLRESDFVVPKIMRFFHIVAQARGSGLPISALLIVDGDKWDLVQQAWDDARRDSPELLNRVKRVRSCERDNDIESNFCDREFLLAYFASVAPGAQDLAGSIDKCLLAVKDTNKVHGKGCTAIAKLHNLLLGEDNRPKKEHQLASMIGYFLQHEETDACGGVRARLRLLRDELRQYLLSE